MIHFVYIWFDKTRKMFYIGKHSGAFDDGYTTSSKWLKGEIRYRPQDFKRRILAVCATLNDAQKVEGKLHSYIKDHEYGVKYYHYHIGKPKGIAPWNKGKIFVEKVPKPKKIRTNRASADNARKGAAKLSEKAKGRKRSYNPDGSWTWIYPVLVNKDYREPQST